jgi:hypothetical protein
MNGDGLFIGIDLQSFYAAFPNKLNNQDKIKNGLLS